MRLRGSEGARMKSLAVPQKKLGRPFPLGKSDLPRRLTVVLYKRSGRLDSLTGREKSLPFIASVRLWGGSFSSFRRGPVAVCYGLARDVFRLIPAIDRISDAYPE